MLFVGVYILNLGLRKSVITNGNDNNLDCSGTFIYMYRSNLLAFTKEKKFKSTLKSKLFEFSVETED